MTAVVRDNWGLVGHEWAVDMLRHAIAGGRPAHAYLVSGPRHIGKALFALRLAQALNCERGGTDACNECRTCRRIANNNYPDVRIASLETQAASLKSEEAARQRDLRIDTVRTWLADINLRPYEGRRRVFILDDVERLTDGAANAMLKVLEEPPPYATLILLAHTAGDIMATIVSRCQQLKLRPVPRQTIATWLYQHQIGQHEASLYAAWSDGLPGLAWRYSQNPEIVTQQHQQLDELLSLSTRPLNEAFKWAEEQAKAFRGGEQAEVYATITLWQRWWRDVLMVAAGLPDQVVWLDRQADLTRVARGTGVVLAADVVRRLTLATRQLRENANPALVFEQLILQLPDRQR